MGAATAARHADDAPRRRGIAVERDPYHGQMIRESRQPRNQNDAEVTRHQRRSGIPFIGIMRHIGAESRRFTGGVDEMVVRTVRTLPNPRFAAYDSEREVMRTL